MPACASECGYSSGSRFRSSSPPYSRSNSASPPLSWPVSATASPTSGSTESHTPIGTLKRSESNVSSCSLSESSAPAQKCGPPASGGSSERLVSGGAPSPSRPSLENRPYNSMKNSTEDTEARIYSIGAQQHRTNQASTRRTLEARRKEGLGEAGVAGSLSIPARLFAWYVNILLRLSRRSYESLIYIVWSPVLWISAWICVFWCMIQLPLILIKWLIRLLYTPALERSRSKRCVLISGGSTLQGLHLARNFYKAGARVVVCEIDGLFGLARFSTACSRYYSVPRPGPGSAAEYVDALKKIVKRERAVYFIPVSCTSGAYYDALAKPHLEIIGCECFVPDAAQLTALEDPLKLLERCSSLGLSTPVNYVIDSPDGLVRLYENGSITGNDRHVLLPAGPLGMRERIKLRVPSSSADRIPPEALRHRLEQHEISERRPWIVIREPAINRGHQFVTCTTVKDSRVVANVTCRIDESNGLIPESRSDVDQWLEIFFARPFATRFNGHLSFKLAPSERDDGVGLVPVGCRVGVPLPYLCFTSVHPRFVWRPCRHFSRHNSANFLLNERYKRTASSHSLGSSSDFSARTRTTDSMDDPRPPFSAATTVLDKRDALFVYWDPLPYCAYYHLQLPFRRLAGVIRERPVQHKPPLAVVR